MKRANAKETFALCLAICVVALTVGCTSISSTMLNRLDSDDFVGNSNGDLKKHCKARPFKGIPITLRVPTHVDVAVREKVRFSKDGDSIALLRTGNRHLFVETDLIYTDKVFTVDIKRPAAGTANYTLDFGEGENAQYFKQLQSTIVDETIQDITTAIDTVTSAAFETGEDDDDKDKKAPVTFFSLDRTVAWKRFDVDAVDFEQAIATFVEQHMNGCSTCLNNQANDTPSPANSTHLDELDEEPASPELAAPEIDLGPIEE